ncbi:MAG: reverse transcriptase family protein [bacterium]|nr:reverse transcriptase family protein [bacterium]
MTKEGITPVYLFHGRDRVVWAPNKDLKVSLQEAHGHLWQLLSLDPEFSKLYRDRVVHGFVPKRNSLTHAGVHKEAGTVLNLDLYRAFESTSKERAVRSIEAIGASPQFVDFLKKCAFVREILPPGFPTSPDLFNAVLLPIDKLLIRLAQEHTLRYSRYADDLTFSTPKEVPFVEQEIVNEIRRIIQENGYDVHKIRFGHPWKTPTQICGISLYRGSLTLPTSAQRRIRSQVHRHLILDQKQDPQKAMSFLGHLKKTKGYLPQSLKRYEKTAKKLIKDQKK